MLNHELRPFLLSDKALRQLVREAYGVDFSTAQLLKDNFNFVFATKGLILRFSPARKKRLQEINAELSWTRFLNHRGLRVNRIVPAKSGVLYLTIAVADEVLYLVAFEKSLGATMEGSDWNTQHFAKLGALTGQLHRASMDFQPQVNANFPHWHQQSKCAAFPALPEDERQLPAIHQSLHNKFIQLPQLPDQYGVIHYDIHQGNYFLLRDQAGAPLFLFDFELTCLGWYLQDIAVILYYASNYNTSKDTTARPAFEQQFLEAFVPAYREYLPDLVFDPGLLQAHLLYRDLFVYAFVLDAWVGRELSAGDQRFIRQLEENISTRSTAQGFA